MEIDEKNLWQRLDCIQCICCYMSGRIGEERFVHASYTFPNNNCVEVLRTTALTKCLSEGNRPYFKKNCEGEGHISP